MNTVPQSRHPIAPARGRIDRAIAALGSAAALAVAVACGPVARLQAADCKLSIVPEAGIVRFGEEVGVNVLAQFPAAAYAFAASEFDVYSSHAEWTYASGGALVGNDVLGIVAGQAHEPQFGNPADPSNPIRVWHGLYTPESEDPAFVQFKADPAWFEVYPSALTGSSAPCDAVGSEGWLFANPLFFGGYGAAPGAGTAMDTSPDGFVATGGDSILIGMLLPAVQSAREAASRLRFSRPPEALTVGVHPEPSATLDGFSLNFTKITFNHIRRSDGRYDVHVDYPLGVGLQIQFMRKGRVVATTTGESGETLFVVDRLPDVFGTRTRSTKGIRGLADRQQVLQSFTAFGGFTGGVRVAVGDVSGDGDVDAADFLIWQRNLGTSRSTSNNLKQIGIAVHSFEVIGGGEAVITPIAR